MNRKKVWLVVPTLGCGGAEQMVVELAREMKKRPFDVTLIVFYDASYSTPDKIKTIERCGLEICYLNKRPGFDPGILWKLIRKIRKERPDIVHSHICAFPYAALLRCFMPFVHIHTMHSVAGIENGRIYRTLMRHMAKRGKTMFVTLNADTQRTLEERYPVKRECMACIPNGVDLEMFYPVRRNASDCVHIIAVGSLIPVKNHRMLIRAFAHVEKTRDYRDRLTILGEGELRTELENEIADSGLSGNVCLPGRVEDVRTYLNAADIFVMTSRYEGISLALLEAAATGLPVIATATGGTPETVGEDAVLIADNDEKALEEKLALMMSDSGLRENYAESAVRIAQRHSLKQMSDGYAALYASMQAGK